jgi:hypothetical protein
MKKLVLLVCFTISTCILFAQSNCISPQRTTRYAPVVVSSLTFELGSFYDNQYTNNILIALEKRINGYKSVKKGSSSFTCSDFSINSGTDTNFGSFITNVNNNNNLMSPTNAQCFADYIKTIAVSNKPVGYEFHSVQCRRLELAVCNGCYGYTFEFKAVYVKYSDIINNGL